MSQTPPATKVRLAAMLCTQFYLDPVKDGVILTRAEAIDRGIASGTDSADRSWEFPGRDLSMDFFRQEIKKRMDQTGSDRSVALTFDDGPSGSTTPLLLSDLNASCQKIRSWSSA